MDHNLCIIKQYMLITFLNLWLGEYMYRGTLFNLYQILQGFPVTDYSISMDILICSSMF